MSIKTTNGQRLEAGQIHELAIQRRNNGDYIIVAAHARGRAILYSTPEKYDAEKQLALLAAVI